MNHNHFYIVPLTLLLVALPVASYGQEAPKPEAPSKPAGYSQRLRAQPPTTEANADEVVARAVEAARKPDFKGYNDTNAEGLVTEYPLVTLKRLKPYTSDASQGVRTLIINAAGMALSDEEAVDVQADALSLLIQVALVPNKPGQGVSQTSALADLHARLFAARREKREVMRQKVDMAALKAALVSYLDRSYADSAALMLTLFASDATLKPFVDKIAVREDYSTSALVLQSAWGAGNAIGALQQRLELGDPADLKFLAQNILAINEPSVLRALWKQLDNKKEIGEHPVGNPNGDWKMVHPRVCDFVLAAFRWKFDGDPDGWTFSRFPIVATDAELDKDKARYHDIIAALPQIGEQVGNAFEPF